MIPRDLGFVVGTKTILASFRLIENVGRDATTCQAELASWPEEELGEIGPTLIW